MYTIWYMTPCSQKIYRTFWLEVTLSCRHFMTSYIEITSGPQFHTYQPRRLSTMKEMLTWVSMERRLLVCRWAAKNSRGPSNSKVIWTGCPPKVSLSHPIHLLSVYRKERQTSASVQSSNNTDVVSWIHTIIDIFTYNNSDNEKHKWRVEIKINIKLIIR